MITVLLAAYNGQEYLAEQLDSLLSQSEQRFVVHICDDASTDSTWEIITHYAANYPNKFTAHRNEKNSGGAKYNFMKMMVEHKDDYVMLCDQDDVWLPDKIKKTLAAVQALEEKHGTKTPVLVHTDLCVVNRRLEVISDSFIKAMNANYSKTALHQQLIQNTLTGCTAMYNRALADLLTEMPTYMEMHDWFLMLTASAFGVIEHINEPTVLYRQHGSNEIGAKDVKTLRFVLNKLRKPHEIRQAIQTTYAQAWAFLTVFSEKLSPTQIELIYAYVKIPKLSKLGRLKTIFRYKFFKNGFMRNSAYLFFV